MSIMMEENKNLKNVNCDEESGTYTQNKVFLAQQKINSGQHQTEKPQKESINSRFGEETVSFMHT